MPHQDMVTLAGTIQHVFSHRFTVEADGKVYLADLTPKGIESFPLSAGLPVTLEGERRPSEIKVTHIATAGRKPISIDHKKPDHGPAHADAHAVVDPAKSLAAISAAGWTVMGEPRRKPKHFEILARKDDAVWTELHVEFDGAIKKTKDADRAKWGIDAT